MATRASSALAATETRQTSGGFANELRAVRVVWQREVIRFAKDRPRLIAGIAQPVLYLFVMGTGISAMVPVTHGVPFRTFLLPGVMTMTVLFTCFFSAGSLVWDRELGFMREMMVAPVARSSILIGKCLGGMTAGMFQGLAMIIIGATGGVTITWGLLATLIPELMLVSFALTAFGVAIATRMKSIQAFMAIMQMVLFPMFFASGALYPLQGLPGWLEVLTRFDPLTYAVAPLRHAVLDAAGHGMHAPTVTWGTWPVPLWLDLVIVAVSGVVALVVALPRFASDDT